MSDSFLQSILSSSIVLLVLLTAVSVIMAVYNWRRMKKQKTYYENIHKTLAAGQRVSFAGGLFGKLVRVGKETCDVELKDGTVIEVSRYAIQEIIDSKKKN